MIYNMQTLIEHAIHKWKQKSSTMFMHWKFAWTNI